MSLRRGTSIEGLFRKKLSRAWVLAAFPPTAPAANRAEIICDDDCPNCPLYKNGCAGNCNRWENLVCNDCPCLGSRNADWVWEPETVDPEHPKDEDVPIKPCLIAIRRLRKELEDGEKVDVRDIK